MTNWMSWEGGVDLVAMTGSNPSMPNIILHLARMVHTPVGSAPSGMVLYQPDPAGAPEVAGFVSHDPEVGKYFGPNIFRGTPFEAVPVLPATIEIVTSTPGSVKSRLQVGDHLFEVTMSGLGPLELVYREPSAMPPFFQQGLEAAAAEVSLAVNGAAVDLSLPPVGISGGPPAVWSPTGLYAR